MGKMGRILGAAAVTVGLATCDRPPAEKGCDWVYQVPAAGNDTEIFCNEDGSAVVLIDGAEIVTNAPCQTGADGYPEIDYTVCGAAFDAAFAEEEN